ncbi:MAG: 2-keto-4-pentenoate hydratase [Erythrobacter sp.]
MTMLRDDDSLDQWAAALASARLMGRTVIDPPGPITLHEGYRLAQAGESLLGTPAGWKIGATSERAMAFLGVTEPIMGRLYAERIWHHGDRAVLAGDRPAEAEPEIAFHLARPLAAGGDPLASIGAAHAAAEIVRPSHPDPFRLGTGFIVADNAAGLGALIGPPIPLAELATPERIAVSLAVDAGKSTTGQADAVLGNPLAALAWLAGKLGSIPAGAWVLSGSMAPAIPLQPAQGGGVLVLDAGHHGTATLRF